MTSKSSHSASAQPKKSKNSPKSSKNPKKPKKPYLIDTHCHLHDPEFFDPIAQKREYKAAMLAGVKKFIVIGTDPNDSFTAAKFAVDHKGVYWTFGFHPSECAQIMPESIMLGPEARRKLVAVGEIGLDYHYNPDEREAQIALFEKMLQFAQDNRLPVSLHIREAFADALAVLDNFSGLQGVVHSFTGSKKELKQVLDRGFYVGVNGLATYTTIPLPPLDRMLLETDAPFLTPAPNRGKINSPRYVREIATYLANELGVAVSAIAEETTNNARKLFNI